MFKHVLGMIAAAVLTIVCGGAAQAQTSVTTCTGDTHIHYSPGLTLVSRPTTVSFSGTFGPCTSTSLPDLTSATTPTTTSLQERSCTTLLEIPPVPITQTITWNTGQSTTFVYTAVVNNVSNVLVVTGTGTVTSGLFQGASVVKIVAIANPDPFQTLACLSPDGLTDLTGTNSLTFTQM